MSEENIEDLIIKYRKIKSKLDEMEKEKEKLRLIIVDKFHNGYSFTGKAVFVNDISKYDEKSTSMEFIKRKIDFPMKMGVDKEQVRKIADEKGFTVYKHEYHVMSNTDVTVD